MSIVEKFKNVLSSNEVRELKQEINHKAKSAVGAARERAQDAREEVQRRVKKLKGEVIEFDDLQKIDLRIGTIISVAKVPNSDKLYQLSVDFGEEENRTVISGIAKHYTMKSLKKRQALFVTNLEPRKIMGIESEAMIVAVSDEKNFSLLSPEKGITPGTKAS